MIDPIIKTLKINHAPARAFDLFTGHLGKWWPVATHSLSADRGMLPQSVTLDPQLGGHVCEVLGDGSTGIWGTITLWDPPHEFAMSWHVGRPETEATRIQVRFDPIGEGTEITLTHDGWEARGDHAAAIRKGYFTGWDIVLGQSFADYSATISVLG